MRKKATSATGAVKNISVVKKNVAAIHIEAKLSLVERKLSNALLFNAYENLLTKRQHSIDIRTMSALIGFDSKDDSILKMALEKLVSTTIKWNILDEKGAEEWGVSSLLAFGRIKAGICTYEYSSALAEKFYNPDIYARINLSVQRNIVSSYTLVLYETCLRFLGVGSTGWIDLVQFKKIMGASENSLYDNFKYLNNRIIKPSVDEINKTTNIFISVEFKRFNRSITDIRFSVKENPQLMLLDVGDDDDITRSDAFQKLLERGISRMIARQWIIEYGENYVLEKLEITTQATNIGKIKSVGGFLTKAVEGDYKSPEIIIKKNHGKAREEKISIELIQKQIEKIDASILKIERTNRSERRKIVDTCISGLAENVQKSLEEEFSSLIETDFARADFRKKNWKSPLNEPQLISFLSQKFDLKTPTYNDTAIVLSLPSLDDLKANKEALKAKL